MNAVEVELAAVVGLVVHPPHHVVDRCLVGADVERPRPLARGPLGDMTIAAHPHAGLGSERGRWIEVPRRPVPLDARVVPGEPRDNGVVERGVIGIDRHPGRVLVLAGQAAAGALFSALLPPVDPVQVDDELVAASTAQHAPSAPEVDLSFHEPILWQCVLETWRQQKEISTRSLPTRRSCC